MSVTRPHAPHLSRFSWLLDNFLRAAGVAVCPQEGRREPACPATGQGDQGEIRRETKRRAHQLPPAEARADRPTRASAQRATTRQRGCCCTGCSQRPRGQRGDFFPSKRQRLAAIVKMLVKPDASEFLGFLGW